jgi:hypothetical protein
MLNCQRLQAEPTVVTIGFAARSDGRGIAFAAVQPAQAAAPSYWRIPFALCPKPALQGRDVTYAATNAVTETLLERGVRNVTLRVEDPRLANDLRERGSLPIPLTVPYVALRCRLNRFDGARIEAREDPLSRDLVSRARAEATLDIAA